MQLITCVICVLITFYMLSGFLLSMVLAILPLICLWKELCKIPLITKQGQFVDARIDHFQQWIISW